MFSFLLLFLSPIPPFLSAACKINEKSINVYDLNKANLQMRGRFTRRKRGEIEIGNVSRDFEEI